MLYCATAIMNVVDMVGLWSKEGERFDNKSRRRTESRAGPAWHISGVRCDFCKRPPSVPAAFLDFLETRFALIH